MKIYFEKEAKAGKTYGFGSIVFDVIMCYITGGLWFFWMFFRYVRTH